MAAHGFAGLPVSKSGCAVVAVCYSAGSRLYLLALRDDVHQALFAGRSFLPLS